MPSHPENESGVRSVPATPPMPSKKGPRLLIILIPHQDPHPRFFQPIPPPRASRRAQNTPHLALAAAFVFLPDDGEEERAGAVHDCYVGEFPVAVVGD